ncbi:MAG TPA: S1 RNA-binding domain-containing protein [Atribacteraceae bacterium]|nr:S1 RNA-binding domain-containing protein [Atribacteraceae bacterium]
MEIVEEGVLGVEENNNMDLLHENLESMRSLRPGDLTKGKVINKGDEGYFVNINYKAEGILPLKEKALGREGEIENDLKEGDEVWVTVSRQDDQGYMWLSRERARYRGAWIDIEESMSNNKTLMAKVKKKVKGGLTVDVGINAFLPASCLDLTPQNVDDFVGQTIPVRVIEADRKTKNVVVSRKIILEEELHKLRSKTIESLEIDQIKRGTVKNVTNFGAFVDLGGIDGLLHISEISWGRTVKMDDVLTKGDQIEVKIIGWNSEKQEISLSLKRLTPDPWEAIGEKMQVGDIVSGKVVSVKDFGIFLEIEEGVEGLIHISDISWGYVKHPREAVKIGDIVQARVLEIDKGKQRLSLGLKQVIPDPWDNQKDNFSINSIVRVKVTRINPKGAMVELEEGVEGRIPLEELSWKRVSKVSEVLRRNQVVEGKIIDVDPENRQVTISLKQVRENPWVSVRHQWRVGDVVQGTIQRLMNFGAFVELAPEVEALLPLSELDWESVKHPGQILRKSQELPLKIIEFNPEEQRIVVSRKSLLPDPWSSVKAKYPVGTVHEGKVVRLVDFGAFVELEEGWDGLVHISEIADRRINSPAEVLEEGQTIKVAIIKLDDEDRKIGLSIKQAEVIDGEKTRKETPTQNGRITLGDVIGEKLSNILNNFNK